MASSLEITGTLHEVYERQQISEKFVKREFILKTQDGNYEQFVKMQLTGDKCDLIDNYNIGDELCVQFNLNGRPYEKNGVTTYFTSISAWRISQAGGGVENRSRPTAQAASSYDDSSENLPF